MLLFAPALGHPSHKPPHARPIAPEQMKEFPRVQFRRFRAVKGFDTPTYVRASPGMQAMPSGRDPVVANGSEEAAEAHRAAAYHPTTCFRRANAPQAFVGPALQPGRARREQESRSRRIMLLLKGTLRESPDQRI
jgi:hypothetical protein